MCHQPHSEMCHTSLCDEAEQSDVLVKGCTNWVERWIRHRGVTTITTQTILHSYIPTVTQYQALQCADSRQVQHTKIHQFTGDRTANTKRGNQYRLQFQAFNILFFSRYSSGGADQLVLSTELTADCYIWHARFQNINNVKTNTK